MVEDHVSMNISVIVPVYNSELLLPELVRRLRLVLEALEGENELILVNDGSVDHGWDVIRKLVSQHEWIRGINLARNYGQHNALLCGIRAAHHDVIVTMDDDLQNPPEEIPRLLQKLKEGYDVVYGTPQQEQHGLARNLASRVTKMALEATMGIKTARMVSAFRIFRTGVREAFANYQAPFVSVDVLLALGTSRFAVIPVHHDPRPRGVSSYTFKKLITHAFNMITGFSTLPLRIASLLGFGFTLFGLGVLAYVLGRYLIEGGSVPGFPFLASIVAIFSGTQLFVLGIIGEYLARMHFRIMERPQYVIRESINLEME
jgi:undecaprenyl-phosphate 4-deoxy-4-formamido-L-arabinose transferase